MMSYVKPLIKYTLAYCTYVGKYQRIVLQI